MDRASLPLSLAGGRLGGSLRSLWAWWLGELRAMVPPRLRELLRGRGHMLLIDMTDRVAIVRSVRAQGEEEVGQVLLENTAAANRRLQFNTCAERLPGGSREVIARVPPGRLLRKVLDLPAAAQENLREILGLEMDRLTPFSVADVYYTHRVLEVDRLSKRLSVELLILPRAVADPAMETVRSLGLPVDRLEVMTEGPRGRASAAAVDFLPASAGTAGPSRRRSLTLVLAATALALLVAAMVLPLRQQGRLIEALEAEVAAAKLKADAGRKVQAEMEQAIAQSQFIVRRKRERPAFVDVLDELTALLPDNTWLIRIRYYSGELQAFGNSPAASALVGVLEASSLFANAQFRAPVTRDPRLGIERFHIGAQVVSPEKAETAE